MAWCTTKCSHKCRPVIANVCQAGMSSSNGLFQCRKHKRTLLKTWQSNIFNSLRNRVYFLQGDDLGHFQWMCSYLTGRQYRHPSRNPSANEESWSVRHFTSGKHLLLCYASVKPKHSSIKSCFKGIPFKIAICGGSLSNPIGVAGERISMHDGTNGKGRHFAPAANDRIEPREPDATLLLWRLFPSKGYYNTNVRSFLWHATGIVAWDKETGMPISKVGPRAMLHYPRKGNEWDVCLVGMGSVISIKQK